MLAALALVLLLEGCTAVEKVAVGPFYQVAPLPPEAGSVMTDLAYFEGDDAHTEKHRLDLYRPAGSGWPILVFVHGGSLENGDKALRIGGFDIYGNVGRFYAARGVGVAVVNYRLQPEVRWPEQADDVARAIAWVQRHARDYGSSGELFLSGHSAGAWLAAHAILDETRAKRFDLGPDSVEGFISVSGSGYDLTDRETWQTFGREKAWEKRFATNEARDDWRERASVLPLLGGPDLPPFLLVYTSKEWPALGRQNQLMREALVKAGAGVKLVALETDSHRRMLLAMSRADKRLSGEILSFIQDPYPVP